MYSLEHGTRLRQGSAIEVSAMQGHAASGVFQTATAGIALPLSQRADGRNADPNLTIRLNGNPRS